MKNILLFVFSFIITLTLSARDEVVTTKDVDQFVKAKIKDYYPGTSYKCKEKETENLLVMNCRTSTFGMTRYIPDPSDPLHPITIHFFARGFCDFEFEAKEDHFLVKKQFCIFKEVD